jgi:methionyl-tRNA formyltransferase
MGSGSFALPVLSALVDSPAVEVAGVLTPLDRPAGRQGTLTPVPVAVEARRLGLPLLQPERLRTPETVAEIAGLRPELGVVADFGRIVPPGILEIPRHGILNVHPSLLPRHRGATPVPATIMAGDRIAGVTVIRMDAGLDTGPVIDRRAWALAGTETAPELEARAAGEGAALLAEVIGPYLRGERRPTPQDGEATLTRPLRRDDGRLDPTRSAVELERQVRAYQPWPGSFVETSTGRLAILRAAVGAGSADDPVGALVADDGGLALATADGRLLLVEVRPAGGRPMTGAAYRRGRPGVIGRIVGHAS